MKRIAWQTITLILVLAGTALASTSGTPLDTVSTQVMTLVSGPIALLLIIAGFAGAGIIYFMGRNFEVAFLTLAGLAVGGVLCSQIQSMATYLFPLAGALIR
jgi:type IV secretory pathway VirB2 component (pilin)